MSDYDSALTGIDVTCIALNHVEDIVRDAGLQPPFDLREVCNATVVHELDSPKVSLDHEIRRCSSP